MSYFEEEELNDEDQKELSIMHKEEEIDHERFGYYGINGLGMVFIAVAIVRMLLGNGSNFTLVNTLLFGFGILLSASSYFLRFQKEPTTRELRFVQEREKEQYHFQEGTWGFYHDINPATVRSRPK